MDSELAFYDAPAHRWERAPMALPEQEGARRLHHCPAATFAASRRLTTPSRISSPPRVS